MSITFRFRSSINFESIQIKGDKPYISINQLRSKIMCLTKLDNVYPKNFYLILGLEYKDPRFEIRSGSSVIVMRVPVGRIAPPILQKLQATELGDGFQKGLEQNRLKKIVSEERLESDSLEKLESDSSEKVAGASSLDRLYAGLLPKCPICKTNSKEAVILPCCNRSFCDKCIRKVLSATGSCPHCSSTKCGTVLQFLQVPADINVPEHNSKIYAPDGESCIKGDIISSDVLVNKNVLNSTSNKKKRSNDGTAECAYKSQDLNRALIIPQANMSVIGGDRRFTVRSRTNRMLRTCYMCRLPGHVIRDCPIALSQHPMSQAGDLMFQAGVPYYATPPYWGSDDFPTINPCMNMYGSPWMMPFDGSMVPFTPDQVPQYIPYSDLPAPRNDEMRNMKHYQHPYREWQSGNDHR